MKEGYFMFLYNLKLNGNRLVKFLFIVMLLIILVIFSVSIYNIFLKNESRYSQEIKLTDTIKSDKIFEITPENYTNILQAVTEDIDSYIGCKVHFTGYVYRLIDFDKNEFVLARDMIVNENTSQSLVVGFLCTYDTAYEFKDNTWVDITGTIVKGEYYGDIAQIKVDNMFVCNEPENKFVSDSDNSYVPTSSMSSQLFILNNWLLLFQIKNSFHNSPIKKLRKNIFQNNKNNRSYKHTAKLQ